MAFNRKKAFTLIELLVVISIIALIMGILLPSLSMARQASRSLFCLNNLRQMVIAATNYTFSNDDYYPLAQWSDKEKSYYWDFTTVRETDDIEHGLLWQEKTINEIQQCPSYQGSDNCAGIEFTGYNYNTSYIGHGQQEITGPGFPGQVIAHPVWPQFYEIVMPAKAQNVMRPAQCALFGDGQYKDGANKFMRAPKVWAGDRAADLKPAGTQGYRHLGKTNVAFCDGHAESWDPLFTDTTDSYTKNRLDKYNQVTDIKIGFLSKDNDLYDLH